MVQQRFAECNAEGSWGAVSVLIGLDKGTSVVKAVVFDAAGREDGTAIAAVGVTGHMGGAWLVDGAGRPVRNAICWPDGRAVDFQDELERDGRLDRVFAISGTSSMPGMSLMAL